MHQLQSEEPVKGRPTHEEAPTPEGFASFLDLEAEVLKTANDALLAWVFETINTIPRHVLDLGSGSGSGAFSLLERFPEARVTAVDSSPQMVQHQRRRATVAGLGERLTVMEADLDDGLPAVDGVDLAWASSSLHHLGHPGTLIGEVGQALPVNGWFVVVETEDVPWLLPPDLGIGQPGLEARCHELLARRRAEHTPHMGGDWRSLLDQSGLAVRAARAFDVSESVLSLPAARYAHGLLSMLRNLAAGALDAEDLATLDVLLDESDSRSVTRRHDLVLTTTRRAWLAQRPDA